MNSTQVQDVLTIVEPEEQEKVKAMVANYQLSGEDFEDKFELINYQLSTENEGFKNAGHAVQAKLVIDRLEIHLRDENAAKLAKSAKAQTKAVKPIDVGAMAKGPMAVFAEI